MSKLYCGEGATHEVLLELHSAQLISELLQEKFNKNPERGSTEPPSICVWECTVVNNHGSGNLVNSNNLINTSNLMRHIPLPGETSNCYSLLDNFQGTSRNPSTVNVRNGKFINHVIRHVNHSIVAKIHHNKSKKVANM
jgi:hypothetical protein